MTILLLSLIFHLVQHPAHGLVLPTFRIGLLTHLWDILIYHHSILLIALIRTLLDVRHRTTNFSILWFIEMPPSQVKAWKGRGYFWTEKKEKQIHKCPYLLTL